LSDHEPSAEVASPGIGARRWVALAVVLSGIFVTVMDSSIVNVAIPIIRSTLHASFGEAELTVATYALAFSAGMITGGRLGDIYGQRRVFMVAFAAFTLTSFVCGVAPNIEVLIVEGSGNCRSQALDGELGRQHPPHHRVCGKPASRIE
jgi:predicted MFS family arabinose efflux permease